MHSFLHRTSMEPNCWALSSANCSSAIHCLKQVLFMRPFAYCWHTGRRACFLDLLKAGRCAIRWYDKAACCPDVPHCMLHSKAVCSERGALHAQSRPSSLSFTCRAPFRVESSGPPACPPDVHSTPYFFFPFAITRHFPVEQAPLKTAGGGCAVSREESTDGGFDVRCCCSPRSECRPTC